VYCQDFIFCLPRDDNEKRWKQFLNILLECVTFLLNERLNFPTCFDISRFPKKSTCLLTKTFALLYPMSSVPGEDGGLGICMEPARVLIEIDSLNA
jgi:hypothetical protein